MNRTHGPSTYLAAGAVSLALLACSPSPAIPPLIPDGTGTVGGIHTFTVRAALAFVPSSDGGTGLGSSSVVLTDVSTNCEDVTARKGIPYASWTVETVMASLSDDTLVPGTVELGEDGGIARYPDGGPRYATALAEAKHDADLVDIGASGTLVYGAADEKRVEGALNVQMVGSNGVPYALTAKFTAPICTTFHPF